MKRLLIATALAVCAASGDVLAAPSVNGAQGTFGNRQAVTIQGSGFGQKSPAAPLVWADFESNINPSVGGQKRAWDEIQSMQWVKGEGYAGSAGAKGSNGSGIWSLRTDYDSWTRDGQTLYLFKKERMNFLVTDLSQNWKSWRMWPAGYGYPNIYAAPNNGRVFVEKVSSQDSGLWGNMMVRSTNWVTQEIILRASTINQKNGYFNMRYDGRSVAEGSVLTRTSEAPTYMNWNYVVHGIVANHGLWSPGWSESNRIWADDVYVDNTWARVLIGNASTYDGSTQFEIQLPTAWSANSVSIIAHTGAMAQGSKAYVYVFDRDGQVNSQGFPVTIGNSGNALPSDAVTVPAGPVANAGPDVVTAVNTPFPLRGLAASGAASLTSRWTMVSGEGIATFTNPNSVNTMVSFSQPGSYTLQLEVSDGSLKSLDTVIITVVPSVAATGGVNPRNVFNPGGGETFKILYLLDSPSRLEAEIIDRTGRRLRSLEGGDRPAGEQYLEWDGRNDQGEVVASGVYVVVKRFNGKRTTGKVAVIK